MATGPLEFGVREGIIPPVFDFSVQGGDHRGFALGVETGADAEQARLAGRVGPSADVVYELLFIAQRNGQARALAAADDLGQQIERGGVGMM